MSHTQDVARTGTQIVSHPPEVLARIERILGFHEMTKTAPPHESVCRAEHRPGAFRLFAEQPKVPLPTKLLDAPTGTLRVMTLGLQSLPESMKSPPQDLKTLATWLYLAAGITGKVVHNDQAHHLRAYPSAGALFPTEIYVLAMAIEGLEPGLYHFSGKEFALRKLREGWESISQLKRGRPDLEVLKTFPAAILVSSLAWRSAWRYGTRAYRYCAIDAGHVIENLVQAGTGLGMQTMVRLHTNERNARELVGASKDGPFEACEMMQGLVAWSDPAVKPLQAPAQRPAPQTLPPIARTPTSNGCTEYPEVRQTHDDCTGPGVGVHEVGPPITESCPLGQGTELVVLSNDDIYTERGLMQTMRARRSVRKFTEHGVSRDQFGKLNRLAFRGGTYYPVSPAGIHMGLIRAYWFIHNITGVTPGLWYYHANFDRFTPVRYGDFKFESKYLCDQQEHCGHASALCVMVANLGPAMRASTPDAYRLAHLEAGLCAQRMYLACTAMWVECTAIGSFQDDDLKQALDLSATDYQCVHAFAVGALNRPKTLDVVLPPDPATIQFKAPA